MAMTRLARVSLSHGSALTSRNFQSSALRGGAHYPEGQYVS